MQGGAGQGVHMPKHGELVAWLISNGPHSAAFCYKLGPNRVKVECLCPWKAAAIFQHTHAIANCAWPRPPTTMDMKTLVTLHKCRVVSSLPPSLGFIVWALHGSATIFPRWPLQIVCVCVCV